jgi:Mce-associated membrane protein
MADEVAAPSRKEAGSTSDTDATDETMEAADAEVAADATDDADADPVPDAEVSAAEAGTPRKPMSRVRMAMIAGLVLVVAMGGLAGWLGYQYVQNRQADQQRALFLQVGRQAATNLTSIDWQQADSDVQRVLDSATGAFYDQFQTRAQAFAEVVKQSKSKSVGNVNAAAIESEEDGQAIVLVAVTVNSSNAGAPQQAPRNWRMKLTVEKDGDDAKVSNVDFVP